MSRERVLNLLRTPDERFIGMVNYGFRSNYITVGGARIHYIDEGQGDTVLMLHGEPTWSFMYRSQIWGLRKNYRMVAPDMVGFGKSDKFAHRRNYSFKLHERTVLRFIEKLELKDITLVVHDWGGLIGLALVGQRPDLFKRLVIMNTALPTGEQSLGLKFRLWQSFVRWWPWFKVSSVVNMGCRKSLTKEVRMAYDAPFPEKRHKAGARAWPLLVPTDPDDHGARALKAAKAVLSTWDRPTLVLFSDGDKFFRDQGKNFRELIPGAALWPETVIKRAGHLLTEDRPDEVTNAIRSFLEKT
jgi:haloalkane dehalogenase